MVFSTLEQLEAVMEGFSVLIGHCHGLSGYTAQTESREWCVDHLFIHEDR